MKIGILNVLHAPDDKRVFQKIARSLAQAGHDVISICPSDEDTLEPEQGVSFIAIPQARTFPQRLRSVLRLVKQGKQLQADVYLAPEPESWVAALLIKMQTGAHVVFDVHEHVPTEFAKFFPKIIQPLVAGFTRLMMRFFARWTDHIILTRKSFEPDFQGIPTPRTVIINSTHLQPVCTTVPDGLRAFEHRPTLIHVGIFGTIRGAYPLLEAMKMLKQTVADIACIILGDYVFGREADYRAAIKEAQLEDHLYLMPPVPFDQVAPYIHVADVGLLLLQPGLLNHTFAMPHKLFEYMREERPVIAPDFATEVAHIINEGDCGLLVDVTSPQAIADAVLRLLHSPAEARRQGENGRNLIETRYNWEQEEPRLFALFDQLEQP